MQEKVFKINEGLEISAGEFPSGICIFIAEGGDQVAINITEWERMIAWWEKTSPEMLREKLEEE